MKTEGSEAIDHDKELGLTLSDMGVTETFSNLLDFCQFQIFFFLWLFSGLSLHFLLLENLRIFSCLNAIYNTFTQTVFTREGNGNPLQCSCLENPRDVGAWWAAVCGVTQSRTRLKRLSSSSSSSGKMETIVTKQVESFPSDYLQLQIKCYLKHVHYHMQMIYWEVAE